MRYQRLQRLFRNTVVVAILLMGVSALMYAVIRLVPVRVDLSRQQILSLTEQSTQLLETLSTEVSVTAFLREGEGDAGLILALLREYQRHSPAFLLTVVDPDRDPELASIMGVDTYGTLVFESKYGRRDVYVYQFFTQDPQRQMPVFIGEQMVTGILKALVSFEAPRIDIALFGVERQIQESGFSSFFQALAHDFRQLRLVSLEGPISNPADVMLVVLPSFPLSEAAMSHLKEALLSGRHVILLLDPLRASPVVSEWLADYGIHVLPGVIMDPDAAYFNAVSTLIPTLVPHGITDPMLSHHLSMVLPVVGAVDVSAVTASVSVTPLLVSSRKSWRSQGEEDASIEPGKATGSFVLGALFEHLSPESGRLLLIRDADFLRDEFIAVQGNQDFILNAVSTLLGQYDDVTIRPRLMGGSPIVLTLLQTSWLFVVVTFFMPFVLVVAGIWMWFRRRRQRR